MGTLINWEWLSSKNCYQLISRGWVLFCPSDIRTPNPRKADHFEKGVSPKYFYNFEKGVSHGGSAKGLLGIVLSLILPLLLE